MADIVVLTENNLGKGVEKNPITNFLDVLLSTDANNSLSFGTDNGLYVKKPVLEPAPSVDQVLWTDVTITNANVAMGMSDASNPLQIGTDNLGYVWVRGAVTNYGASLAANSIIATISPTYLPKGYLDSASFYQLCPVQSLLAGNTAANFLRMKSYAGVVSLAFSLAMGTSVTFFVPPTIIGAVSA